jgi:S-formylglutathione hydrolase FrmB
VRKLAVLMQSRQPAGSRKKLRDWNPIDKVRSAFARHEAGISVESPKKWALRPNPITTVLLTSAALLGTIVVSSLIFHTSLTSQVGSFLLSLGFDDERILLINQLMVTLLGTAVTGAILRRRVATILGGIAYFLVFYLKQFLEQVQHPGVGPGGIKLELDPGVLTSVTISLVALGLTTAALGAFVGSAYGELTLGSFTKLCTRVWQAVRQRAIAPLRQSGILLVSTILGVLILVSALISANQASLLLTFGLSTNLYRAVQVHGHPILVGTVEKVTYRSPSLSGITRYFEIYLPPSYSINTNERYPVFYLLHGSPGNPSGWIYQAHAAATEDILLALGKVRPTILVSAYGQGPIYPFSEWADSLDGRQKMEDAVAIDLVQFVDSHYRTLAYPADRAIGGLSSGGFGAPNIALHHPDIFGSVMSVGGYFKAVSTGPVFYGPVSVIYRAYNSPLEYVLTPSGNRAAHQIHFLIGAANQDGVYYRDALVFYHVLTKLGVPVQLLTIQGGHSWRIWGNEFASILPLLDPPVVSHTP